VGGRSPGTSSFFFAHYEGIRIALPIVTSTTLPQPAYQQYVLGQLATGGYDPVTGTNLPAQSAEIPFYKEHVLASASSRRVARGDYSLPAGRIGRCARSASRHAAQRQRLCIPAAAVLNNSDSENLIVVKIDHTIDATTPSGTAFKQDTGCRRMEDPIDSIFNAYSPQPQRTLVIGYTHIFSPGW